jgi:hypothetical protein
LGKRRYVKINNDLQNYRDISATRFRFLTFFSYLRLSGGIQDDSIGLRTMSSYFLSCLPIWSNQNHLIRRDILLANSAKGSAKKTNPSKYVSTISNIEIPQKLLCGLALIIKGTVARDFRASFFFIKQSPPDSRPKEVSHMASDSPRKSIIFEFQRCH